MSSDANEDVISPTQTDSYLHFLPFTAHYKPQPKSTPRPQPTILDVTAQVHGISQPGPGLGNRRYSEGSLFAPIARIASFPEDDDEDPLGHGNVAMVNGYLMVIYSSDGGGSPKDGGIEFWDVSNPQRPKRYRQHENPQTHGLREAHTFGFSSSYLDRNGMPRDLMVAQSINGIHIWDLTNPDTITLVSDMNLPGIKGGDYTGVWWLFWQAPYVYVAATDHGLYVVDASDPARPQLANHLSNGELGGINAGQTFAVGNLLVVMMNKGSGYATLDISDPVDPQLLYRKDGRGGYSHIFAAGKILTSGGNVDTTNMFVHSVSHAGQMAYVGSSKNDFIHNGGYGTYQDGFFHSGFSESYYKFNVNTFEIVGSGSTRIRNRDEDFATVLGNLTFVGNDHGQGSGLIVHQLEPDTVGPAVEWIHPADGAIGLATTTRIGLSMSDTINVESANLATFQVRPVGGTPLQGKYSSQFGLVNFTPAQPLASGVAYEVVVDGIVDTVGNRGPAFSSTFTVGTQNLTAPAQQPPAQIPAESVSDIVETEPPTSEDPVSEPSASEPEANPSASTSPPLTEPTPAPELPQVVYEPLRCKLNLDPVEMGAPVDYATNKNAGRLTYEWEWNDGTAMLVSETNGATHTFLKAGRFPLILRLSRAETGESTTCTAMQIVHQPLTAHRPVHSTSITYHDGVVYNVNPDNNTVTASDAISNTKKWEMPVGQKPTSLAVDPQTDHLWVVNQESAEISVLTGDDGTLQNRIQLPIGSQPFGLVIAPDRTAIFVTLEAMGRVLKLDFDGQVIAALNVGGSPHGIAMGADSKRLLVTRFISPDAYGEVSLILAKPFGVIDTIKLPLSIEPDSEDNGRGLPNYLSQVVISPDSQRALVPSKKDNIERGMVRDGNELTFESTVRTMVATINLTTHQEAYAQRLDLDNQSLAQSALFSPLGDLFFVANLGSNTVQFYETATGRFLGQSHTGNAPMGLAMNDDGSRLFVHNYLGRSIFVYDTAQLISGKANVVSPLNAIFTVANELLSGEEFRGKRIFYNAADPRMSKDRYISCASCHLDGKHDGRVWDATQQGEGLRNTPTLRGFGGDEPSTIHWTANFDELQDFEFSIRNEFGGKGFIKSDPFTTTHNLLDVTTANQSIALDALATYINSLTVVSQSPYRGEDGQLTEQGAAGRAIFEREGCAACHSGQKFSNTDPLTLYDIGTIKPTSGARMNGSLTGLDAPTLRGLWLTAPYLHDGSAATLADAVEAHDGVELTANELGELVAFLRQIDEREAMPE